MEEKRVVLIGYMAAGKSSFGKKIAKALNFRFYDSDKEIERALNTTIPHLFETLGENKFRELESIFINGFNSNFSVLACGGGMPCFNNNIEKLKKNALVIYLKRPVKELVNRLLSAKESRPLIKNKNQAELLSFVEQQLKDREVFYEQAHLVLDRNNQNLQEVVKQIKDKLKI